MSNTPATNETEAQRLLRLFREGSALECLTEANYWLQYYIDGDSTDFEAVYEAKAFAERAQDLLKIAEEQG